ncbi:MAG: glycosyltransferase family 2 protein, partial [Bacteroidales bacterium]|nr:glycosyltransferase family 2 protein [Bacteroidales bacterium]
MNATLKKKLVSILVPCYNEEASLPHLWSELQKIMTDDYDWEVLFVNDGSKDRTLQILNELYHTDPRVSVVDLSRNYGKEKAMLAGFDHVAGDCMVIIDADLQDPPRLIKDMLQKWEEGYDDVYAHRISRGKESWLKKKFSLLFYKILQKGSSLNIPENVGDFRLLDRKCIEALKELRESERYTKGLFCQIG